MPWKTEPFVPYANRNDCLKRKSSLEFWLRLTCWHVRNSATHTQMPASPWAVFVCRKIPSPTWLRGSTIAGAFEIAIKVDCVGAVVVDEDVIDEMVELNTLSPPDIVFFINYSCTLYTHNSRIIAVYRSLQVSSSFGSTTIHKLNWNDSYFWKFIRGDARSHTHRTKGR